MSSFEGILLNIPAIIFTLVIYEFSRAYASTKLGDPSPRIMGKLNLSPLSHIDPIGFMLLILFNFGWSKAVFVDSRYYKDRKKGMILVTLSGTIGTFLLAFVSLALFKLLSQIITVSSFAHPLLPILANTVGVSIYFGLFSLIPLPPLAGFDLFAFFLDYKYYELIQFLRHYGNMILIFLIVLRIPEFLIGWPSYIVHNILDFLTYPFGIMNPNL